MAKTVKILSHAQVRMAERGVTEGEAVEAVLHGERLEAKLGRTAFRHNFVYNNEWLGRFYRTKQVEAIAVQEGGDWIVITVVAKYF